METKNKKNIRKIIKEKENECKTTNGFETGRRIKKSDFWRS
jgi:hypothetical protein